jgi:hypothetical protein
LSLHNRQSNFSGKPQVSFNKIQLNYTGEIKFLSIYITETLKWNCNVQLLASKLSKISFMIKSSKGILSSYMIQNIYFTKFQGLGYCFGVGGMGRELNIRIFRTQKKVIRSMVGITSRTSRRQVFKKLNRLTLALLYTLQVTCFIRIYCQSLELNSNIHKHNT